MNDRIERRVLVVDDEPSLLEVMTLMLNDEGYEVSTAIDGLDALRKIKVATPDLIISDLNMPQMSGFELLFVVRRRFPSIPLIAMSGVYEQSGLLPAGVIADGFYAKGQCPLHELLRMVAQLIGTAESLPACSESKSAPVQIPRNGRSSEGVPFVLLTCPDCLRSFSLRATHIGTRAIEAARCPSCAAEIDYICDASPSIALQRVVPTTHLAAAD
jgi:CheY-like chemotaxis protein